MRELRVAVQPLLAAPCRQEERDQGRTRQEAEAEVEQAARLHQQPMEKREDEEEAGEEEQDEAEEAGEHVEVRADRHQKEIEDGRWQQHV